MIEVRYRGTFGDHLFQYCFGRILAERWGYGLDALPLPGLPGTDESVEGDRYLSPVMVLSGSAVEERQLGTLLREKELRQAPRSRVVLYGWFQRWELYRAHAEQIRRWLECPPPEEPPDTDDFAVCIRFTAPTAWQEPGLLAGHHPGWKAGLLKNDHVRRLAERAGGGRIHVITDQPQAPGLSELAPLDPVIMDANSLATWQWLRCCRRIALPLTHASDWWAAWLSRADEIYALDPWPLDGRALNNRTEAYGCGWRASRPLGRPDLRVNEPRWLYDW